MEPKDEPSRVLDLAENAVGYFNFLWSIMAYVAVVGLFSWYGVKFCLKGLSYLLR